MRVSIGIGTTWHYLRAVLCDRRFWDGPGMREEDGYVSGVEVGVSACAGCIADAEIGGVTYR
jgi:hypothetical protein